MNKNIIVRYSDEFKEEDFLEISKIKNVDVINYKQKGLYPNAYIILLLPVFWFAKGYFTKFGERLGEKSADTLFDSLTLLTNKLFKLVQKKNCYWNL